MSNPPSNPPRWIFAVATVIWALIAGFAARLVLAALAPTLGANAMRWLVGSPYGLAFGAAVIQLVLLGTAVLRASMMPELRAGLLGALRSRPSRFVTAVVLIAGIAPLANLGGILVAKLTGSNLQAIEFVGALVRRASWPEMTVLALTLTLLPALVEETIFRGLVLGSLDELRPAAALLASAVAFGVFHLDVAQGVATAILGLGFGFIVQTTGSLLGAMVAHAAYNLLVLLSQRYIPITETPLEWQLIELGVGLAIAASAALRLYRLRPSGLERRSSGAGTLDASSVGGPS